MSERGHMLTAARRLVCHYFHALIAICVETGESCTFEQLTLFRLAGISQLAVPLDHIELLRQQRAGVVELVDAPDSKSGSERSVGSIPTTRTILVNQSGWKTAKVISTPPQQAVSAL